MSLAPAPDFFWRRLAAPAALFALAVALWTARPDPFAGHGFEERRWNNASFAGPPARVGRALEPFVRLGEHPTSSAEWTGSLWIDHPGLYQFSIESDDDGWLWVDDRLVAQAPGEHPPEVARGEVTLAAGAHSLKIRHAQRGGGAYLRVRWRPQVGPLYTYDLPLPLERITPAPVADGAVKQRSLRLQKWSAACGVGAAVLLLFAILFAWRAVRPAPPAEGRPDARVELALFLFALLARLWDLGRTGGHWDESAYWVSGKNYWRNLSLGDFWKGAWDFNTEHPPVAKWIYGLSAAVSGDAHGYHGAKALAALMTALAVVFAFRAARLLYGRPQAIVAAISLALMPHFLGHGRIAGLEAPSALFFTAAVTYLIEGLARGSGGWAPAFVSSGLCAALALGTRFTNVWLLPLMAAILLAWRPTAARTGELTVSLGLLGGLCAGGALVLLLWPRMIQDPFGTLIEIFQHWNYWVTEYFLGTLRAGPPYYYLVYYAVTSPALVLALFAAFLVRAARERRAADAVVLLWFLAPLGSSGGALRQDGIRYMICMFPALAIACGEAAVWLGGKLGAALERRGSRLAPWGVSAVGASLAVYLAAMCAWVWPHCIDFYGEQVGGAGTVARNKWFEIAWWGEGAKEVVDHVNAHAAPGAKVWVRLYPEHEAPPLRGDLVRVHGPDADWIVVSNFYDAAWFRVPQGFALSHEESAAGAPLARAYRRAEGR